MTSHTMGETDWHQRAQALDLALQPVVNGTHTPSDAGTVYEKINPATGAVLTTIPVGSTADVDRAVAAARAAADDGRWSRLSPLTRKGILLKLADLVAADAGTLALYDTLEMGKPISQALGDAQVAAAFFRYYGEAIDKTSGTVIPADVSTLALNMDEPVGVVAAIVPWNYPVINAALKAAPALAAGNTLVLKPSENACFSAYRLAELALEAGVPDGVFNIVSGLGNPVGQALAEHPDVDLISFTGSTRTGRGVMMAAGASNGKRVMMECGGKSPQLVFADMADILDDVADMAVGEAFANMGQLCVARTRLLVHDSLRAGLVERIAARVAAMELGDPLDPQTACGPLAFPGQKEKVCGYVAAGQSAGATAVGTSASQTARAAGEGCYVAPVVFDGVTPDMPVFREEIFGPVLSVVPFATPEEALALANDTPYGLAATVWTRDYRLMDQMMRGLNAGKITLRASAVQSEKAGFALSGEPFGASGFGAEFGMAGLKSYCRSKAVELIR